MKLTYKKRKEEQVQISQTLIDLFKKTFGIYNWKDKKNLTLSDMQVLRAILHTIQSDHYVNEEKESLINELCSLIMQLHNYKYVEFTIDKSSCPENPVN